MTSHERAARLGISHKTAPVALRERLALTDAAGRALPARARRAPTRSHEAVAISTCNRTELYLVGPTRSRPRRALLGTPGPPRRASARPSSPTIVYSPRNCDAARQLYRVASGLESMIVGEAEVQGQVRRAYEAALAAGTTGPLTNRLFTRRAADRQARAHRDRRSARERVERLDGRRRPRARRARRPRRAPRRDHRRGRDRRAHRAGAGRPAACARSSSPTATPTARASLADRFGGAVVSLDELPGALRERRHRRRLDLVAAPDRRRRGARAGHARPRRAPAAAHRHRRAARHRPRCGELDGVTLYDIDDLQAVVARNLRGPRGRARARPRRSSRRRSSASPRWLGAARRHADDHRAARARRRDRRPGARRERRALGVGVAARPRPHRGARARGHAAAAARADDPPEGVEARARPRRASSCCASCSGSTSAPPDAPTPQAPAGRRRAAAPPASAGREASGRAAARWRWPRRARWPRCSAASRARRAITTRRPRRARRRQGALGRASSRPRCCDGDIDLAVHSAKDVPARAARRAW